MRINGKRLLIVEDKFLVAKEVTDILGDAGAEVIGPFPNSTDAIAALQNGSIDGAILDIDLGGDSIDHVTEALDDRGIPYFFLTGYLPNILPEEIQSRTILGKPFRKEQLLEAVGNVVGAGS